MSSLLETIARQLGGDTMSQISRKLGTDERTTSTAVGAALPTLLGALARNASRGEGGQALHNALAKDHDGSLLDNLGAFIGKAEQGPGDGILRHVLGSRRSQVEAAVGKSSGLGSESAGGLMQMLAPIVMGALGKAQREKQMNAGALAGFLGDESREIERTQPQAAGLLGQLLDTDGDGDVDLGDLAKHGTGLLGKFLSR
jgi:hypothetical protein